MNYTGIEWCTRTLNPVTGCLHGCPYCYARNQVRRFEGRYEEIFDGNGTGSPYKIHELEIQEKRITKKGKFVKAPYPFGFDPTFHRYRLDEPQHYKKPQIIFIGSMCDLFGVELPFFVLRPVKLPTGRFLGLFSSVAILLFPPLPTDTPVSAVLPIFFSGCPS